MKILIDNGHGAETPGKSSPDGRLKEYEWARRCAAMVVQRLQADGCDAALLVPETRDVSIADRVKRANYWCSRMGAKNVLVVSIHNNAAGNGRDWAKARGWLSLIDDTQSQGARRIAGLMYDEAKAAGLTMRHYLPGQKWWLYGQTQGKPARLGLLRGTLCPAVLTENLFQDNREDCAWLLSDAGIETIARVHVEAIKKYQPPGPQPPGPLKGE